MRGAALKATPYYQRILRIAWLALASEPTLELLEGLAELAEALRRSRPPCGRQGPQETLGAEALRSEAGSTLKPA